MVWAAYVTSAGSASLTPTVQLGCDDSDAVVSNKRLAGRHGSRALAMRTASTVARSSYGSLRTRCT